jgi:hypothetical protein
MINKEFIEKIEQMARPEYVSIAGRTYSTKGLSPVSRPTPKAITVHTLTGMIDYITENPDNVDFNDAFIHVDSFMSCRLLGRYYGEFCERDFYIQAAAEPFGFTFNKYHSREEFQIYLMAFFQSTPELSQLLQVVGNTLQNAEITLADNGVTQRTTTRQGIARKAEVDLPNPITLVPYMTFSEIEQPEISYVFRMREARHGGVECALFDADGSRYKLRTALRIKAYLEKHIQGVRIVT